MNAENTDPLNPLIVNQISEEYAQADMYIRLAHKVTARSFWAYSVMIIMVTITTLSLITSYLSYDKQFIKLINAALREDIITKDSISTKKIVQMHGDSIVQSKLKLVTESLRDSVVSRDSITRKQYQDIFGNKIEDIPFKPISPLAQELRSHFIRNYIDTQYINIPLIGVKVSSNDILMLMVLAFIIISWWLLICARSENFTIGKILNLTQKKEVNIKNYIFYGICFNNMFYPITRRSKPYDSLSNPDKSFIEELKSIETKLKYPYLFYLQEPLFTKISAFLPSICVIACCIVHWYDFSFSMVNVDRKLLSDLGWKIPNKLYRFDFSNNSKILSEIIIRDVILWILIASAFLLIFICLYNYRTNSYMSGTVKVLREFKRRFKHDNDCIESIIKNNIINKESQIEIVAIQEKALYQKSIFQKQDTHMRNAFSTEYDKKEYYLLVHTGDINELERLYKLLTIKNDSLPEKFMPAMEKSDVYIFSKKEYISLDYLKKQPLKNYEYFIFLKML